MPKNQEKLGKTKKTTNIRKKYIMFKQLLITLRNFLSFTQTLYVKVDIF